MIFNILKMNAISCTYYLEAVAFKNLENKKRDFSCKMNN